MSIYRDQITFILQEMKEQLDSYKHELEHSVEGHLVVSTTKGRRYYFQCPEDSDGYTKISLSGNTEMIIALARKEFLRRSVDALSSNIRLLENAEKNYKDEQIDVLKEKMHKAYRSLPTEYFLSGDIGGMAIYHYGEEYVKRRHDAWAKEPYEMSSYNPKGRRFPTSAGIYVRSKSEQHIVEQLWKYGVPFRYEQVLHLRSGDFSVDFTFEGSDEGWFFWEHAGMMDKREYAQRHHRKMQSFEYDDIVPWKNLIVTYDVNGVINVPMINSIIENEVIPRL